MSSTPDVPVDDNQSTNSRRRWMKWGGFGALALVLLIAGVFIWWAFFRDGEPALTESDLDAALAAGTSVPAVTEPVETEPQATEAPTTDPSVTDATTAATEPATTDPAATDTTTPATEAPATTGAATSGGGQWVITDESTLGYRVKELLFGVDATAVGRTNEVTGGLTIVGTQVTEAGFSVDVASIKSDESRRDGQFSGRIMSTDEFPTADFVLTEPIELGVESAEGAEVATTATGDLTLRGVTDNVTFDVTAKQENGKIAVLGNIPIVFADYEIANPSIGGVTTEDNGLLEFVLVFELA